MRQQIYKPFRERIAEVLKKNNKKESAITNPVASGGKMETNKFPANGMATPGMKVHTAISVNTAKTDTDSGNTAAAPYRNEHGTLIIPQAQKSHAARQIQVGTATVEIPDSWTRLCEGNSALHINVASSSVTNLVLSDLCGESAVRCCVDPQYEVFYAPHDGGTLDITDPVTGAATYTPQRGALCEFCFVVKISCANGDDFAAYIILCFNVGACGCSPIKGTAIEGCPEQINISDCQAISISDEDKLETKEYTLVSNTVTNGTASVNSNGILTFTPNIGTVGKNGSVEVIVKQGCSVCCLKVDIEIESVCAPCDYEFEWNGCETGTPEPQAIPDCSFCGCSCPVWTGVASAGELVLLNAQGNPVTQGQNPTHFYVIPPKGFAGLITITWTITCYDQTTRTTKCTATVNNCCPNTFVRADENSTTVTFEYKCSGDDCTNVTWAVTEVTEGVNVVLSNATDDSVTLTVTKPTGSQNTEFHVVKTCGNQPLSCFGKITIGSTCGNGYATVGNSCVPICIEDDPECCLDGYVVGGLCLPLCDPNATNECSKCSEDFTPVVLTMDDGTTICICYPKVCPVGEGVNWVNINGTCYPRCVDGQCPQGFVANTVTIAGEGDVCVCFIACSESSTKEKSPKLEINALTLSKCVGDTTKIATNVVGCDSDVDISFNTINLPSGLSLSYTQGLNTDLEVTVSVTASGVEVGQYVVPVLIECEGISYTLEFKITVLQCNAVRPINGAITATTIDCYDDTLYISYEIALSQFAPAGTTIQLNSNLSGVSYSVLSGTTDYAVTPTGNIIVGSPRNTFTIVVSAPNVGCSPISRILLSATADYPVGSGILNGGISPLDASYEQNSMVAPQTVITPLGNGETIVSITNTQGKTNGADCVNWDLQELTITGENGDSFAITNGDDLLTVLCGQVLTMPPVDVELLSIGTQYTSKENNWSADLVANTILPVGTLITFLLSGTPNATYSIASISPVNPFTPAFSIKGTNGVELNADVAQGTTFTVSGTFDNPAAANGTLIIAITGDNVAGNNQQSISY